jgi:hypothetical protein
LYYLQSSRRYARSGSRRRRKRNSNARRMKSDSDNRLLMAEALKVGFKDANSPDLS